MTDLLFECKKCGDKYGWGQSGIKQGCLVCGLCQECLDKFNGDDIFPFLKEEWRDE